MHTRGATSPAPKNRPRCAVIVGPLAGEDLQALLDLIHDGEACVNVHTTQNSPGEIRGQIRVAGPGS